MYIPESDMVNTPVNLEYFNGERWVFVGSHASEKQAWLTLGNDNSGYRTVDRLNGSVIREID